MSGATHAGCTVSGGHDLYYSVQVKSGMTSGAQAHRPIEPEEPGAEGGSFKAEGESPRGRQKWKMGALQFRVRGRAGRPASARVSVPAAAEAEPVGGGALRRRAEAEPPGRGHLPRRGDDLP